MCTFDYRKRILAVSSRSLCTRPFAEQMERVCRWGPQGVILREKDLPEEEYLRLAETILEICRKYRVPCILHTHVEAARRLGCRAIHLPLPVLRACAGELNDFEWIGTSVHSLQEAQEAEKLGAAYLTAGHIYATDCKKGVPPRGTEFLRGVCASVNIPVYAIGGIQMEGERLQEVMECGAAGACVMSGMMRI